MGMGCSVPGGPSDRESGPRVIKLTGSGFASTGLSMQHAAGWHALLEASGAHIPCLSQWLFNGGSTLQWYSHGFRLLPRTVRICPDQFSTCYVLCLLPDHCPGNGMTCRLLSCVWLLTKFKLQLFCLCHVWKQFLNSDPLGTIFISL